MRVDEAMQFACPDRLGGEINPPKGTLMVNEVGEECGEYGDMRGKDSPILQANVRTGHSLMSLQPGHPSLVQLVVGSSVQSSTVTHHLSWLSVQHCPSPLYEQPLPRFRGGLPLAFRGQRPIGQTM